MSSGTINRLDAEIQILEVEKLSKELITHTSESCREWQIHCLFNVN